MSPLFPEHSFLSLRTIIWTTGLLVLALLLLGYVGYQARFFLVGPQLSIAKAPSSPTTNRVVEISGTAHNIVSITLNGRDIFTDPAGSFAERVVLHEGLNTVTIAAKDRFDRQAKIHKEYVYIPPQERDTESSVTQSNGSIITTY